MIVPKHYENLNVLHENTMPHRAYYMPASKDMGSLVHDREKSDRMELLNGNWKFQFYKSIYDLQEKFYEAGYDTKGFDEIPVPGIWQNYGYDSHQYTNVRYPIPLDPPYVPQENPCGAYVHQFEYKKDSKAPKAYLNFEGVDSCFYVWINGVYVGYSQVAHATSEFDVTDHLKEGTNTLAVLVLKWCDGTYLEDQDKFRMTGIFRDVYLLKRPESVLYDYFTTTSIGENGAEIEIRANFLGESNSAENTKIVIRSHEGNTVATGTFKKCDDENFAYKAVLDITNPVLWNPEQPYLYQVLFLSENEVIVDEIKTGEGTFRHDNLTNKVCPQCGKKLLAVNGKNSKMLVCQDRECGYRETISRTTNARCPKCHKRMEMYVKGKEEIFVCQCGYKEKLSAFQARRQKEGAGVGKRDVQNYLRRQQKEANEPVNNAFAQALSGIKL